MVSAEICTSAQLVPMCLFRLSIADDAVLVCISTPEIGTGALAMRVDALGLVGQWLTLKLADQRICGLLWRGDHSPCMC